MEQSYINPGGARERDVLPFTCGDQHFLFYGPELQVFRVSARTYKQFQVEDRDHTDASPLGRHQGGLAQLQQYLQEASQSGTHAVFAANPEGPLRALIMNITRDCNLRCTYCFAFDAQKLATRQMTYQTATQAIDKLFSSGGDHKHHSIVFFGGEPFANWGVMKGAMKYACHRVSNLSGHTLDFSATTNGTLLHKGDIIPVLKAYRVNLVVSLDGPQHVHDKYRVYHNGRGSFNRIMRNIQLLKHHGIPALLRSTITADCDQLADIVKFYEGLETPYGFDFVQPTEFNKNCTNEYTERSLNSFGQQLTDVCDYILARACSGKQIWCVAITAPLRRLHFQLGRRVTCHAGRSMLALNPDGSCYTCQNLSNNSEHSIGQFLSLGDPLSHVGRLKADSVDEMEHCRSCSIRYLCSGGCLAERTVIGESKCARHSYHCMLKLTEWKHWLQLYQSLRERCPRYLQSLSMPMAV